MSGVHVVQLDSLRATFDTLVWRLMRPASIRLDHGGVATKQIELRSSSGGRIFASAQLPEQGPIFVNVETEGVRIATLLRTLQKDTDADGVVSASAVVEGTRAQPTIQGRVRLREARFKESRAPDADVSLAYRDRLATLNAVAHDSVGRQVLSGKAALPLNLALSGVTGSRRLAGPLSGEVVLDSFSLATLPLSSRSFSGVQGKVGAEVRLAGTWREPRYTGRAGSARRRTDADVDRDEREGRVADLSFIGDTLRLDSAVARARGPMRASGTVDLSDRSHPFVRMSASGEDVRVMNQRRGLVDADSDITAVGPLEALRVTGRGEMLGGYLALKQFRKDLLRVKSPGDLSFMTVFDTTAPPGDSARVALARQVPRKFAIVADLTMVIDRGNYYRNRPDANTEFYTGEGEAVVAHIDQRSEDQWAVGFVRIPGGVAFFRTQPFVPSRGSLTFGPHTDAVGIVQEVGERMLWESGPRVVPTADGHRRHVEGAGGRTGERDALSDPWARAERISHARSYVDVAAAACDDVAGGERVVEWAAERSHGRARASAAGSDGARRRVARHRNRHDEGVRPRCVQRLARRRPTGARVRKDGRRARRARGGRPLHDDGSVHGGQIRLTTGIPGFRIAQRFGTMYRIDLGLEPRFLFRAPEELGITHPTLRTGVFGAFLTRSWDF